MSHVLSRQHFERSRGGFTFIEVLVAIAVLVLIAAVVFDTHSSVLKAQAEAKAIEESRVVSARIAGETWLGNSPVDAAADAGERGSWAIETETVTIEMPDGNKAWQKWTVTAGDGSSRGETVLYLEETPDQTVGTGNRQE